MSYIPEPIDTSGIRCLPTVLEQLTELLAKNAHDNWAQRRIAEGWKYGPLRDDARKEHPCLMAYEELPDSEKAYDRITAMETIKAILTLGYRISAPVEGRQM